MSDATSCDLNDPQPNRGPKPRLPLRKRVLFSVLPALLFFAILEVGLRLSPFTTFWKGMGRHSYGDEGEIIGDGVVNHRFRPNLDVQVGIQRIVTNAQGWLCEDDTPEEKAADEVRVFYIGDSNTQSLVPYGERLLDVIAENLRERLGARSRRVKLVNASVESYSTILYYLNVRERILRYLPDIVVVCVDVTDLANDRYYESIALWDGAGRLLAVPYIPYRAKRHRLTPHGTEPATVCQRVHSWLVRNTATAYLANEWLAGFAPQRGLVDVTMADSWSSHEWSQTTRDGIDKTMHYLGMTQELCAQRGVRLVVTGVPALPQVTGEWSAGMHAELEAAAERYGFLYLNSYERLKSQLSGAQYIPGDPLHLNPEGYDLWGREHAEFLLAPENSLLACMLDE